MPFPRRPRSQKAAFFGGALCTTFASFIVASTAFSWWGLAELLFFVAWSTPLAVLVGVVSMTLVANFGEGASLRRTACALLLGGLFGLCANVANAALFSSWFGVWSLPERIIWPVGAAFGLAVGATMQHGFKARRLAIAVVAFVALVPATLLLPRVVDWVHTNVLGRAGDSIAIVTIVQVDAVGPFTVGRGADLLTPADHALFARAGLVGAWRVSSQSVQGNEAEARRVLIALREPVPAEVELEQPGSDPILWVQVAAREFRCFPPDAETIERALVLSDHVDGRRWTHVMADHADGASSGGSIAGWGAAR